MTTQTIKSVQASELKAPALNAFQQLQLLMSLNSVLAETGKVYASLNYDVQTDNQTAKPGKDFVEQKGVDPSVHIGRITSVSRNGDNAKNRRNGTVGAVRFNIESFTRGNGIKPTRPTCIIPSGLTSFSITGFVPSVEDEAEIPAQQAVV